MDDCARKVAEARQRAEAILDKRVQLWSLRLAKEAAERQAQALAGVIRPL